MLVNVPDFDPAARAGAVGTEEYLRNCIQDVLSALYFLPAVAPAGAPAWRCRGPSIAFDLLGSGSLGYGAERAAENVLAAIQGWYNDLVMGPFRRQYIPTVYLLIPEALNLNPDLTQIAWWRAVSNTQVIIPSEKSKRE